ncbi:LysR family transcriptional regulator [Verrucomicrobiota bacterium sgz303538]
MELRHLRYFIAVAEESNVTRAAARLRIAQPALSRQMRDLEEELNVLLFDRTNAGIRLTAAGTVFLKHSRSIVSALSVAVRETQAAAGAAPRRLTVGFLGAFQLSLLQPVITEVQAAFPGLELDFFQGMVSEQVNALRDGKIDLAFVTLPVDFEGLAHAVVIRRDLMVALPMQHRWASKDEIPLEDLAGEKMVMGNRDSRPEFYDYLVQICREAGFTPKIVKEVGGPPANVIGLVSLNLGVTLFAPTPELEDVPNIIWKPLCAPAPAIELALLWEPHRISGVAADFLRIVRERIDPDHTEKKPVRRVGRGKPSGL